MKQVKEDQSDSLELAAQENNAIFTIARNVITFPMEFHHLYMLIVAAEF